jgi:hypothetical protein
MSTDDATYKGATFMSDAFSTFLSNKIFKPISSARPDLKSVGVVFDEHNEVSDNGSSKIVFNFEFDTERRVFAVDSEVALVACYANEQVKSGNIDSLNDHEHECLDQVSTFVSNMLKHVEIAKTS